MLTAVPGYQNPTDICNRALNHCGADHQLTLITDNSKNARLLSKVYARLRQAELRRNPWNFAIKRAMLRPVSTTTVLWTPPLYAVGTTYAANYVVSYDDGFGPRLYVSLTGANTGNTPGPASAFWDDYFGAQTCDPYAAAITFYPGEITVESNVVYMALVQTSKDPATTPTDWLAQGGTNAAFTIMYPLTAGPVDQTTTANVYILPYGYLRKATQNPKAAINSILGAPLSGRQSNDWLIEGNYLLTTDSAPIAFRYVADVSRVTKFDPMFAEAFASRIALEVCEPITQSTEKLTTISKIYHQFVVEARLVNGIEAGPEMPDEDDFITTRL